MIFNIISFIRCRLSFIVKNFSINQIGSLKNLSYLSAYVDVLKVLFHFHHLRSSLWTGPYILMHIKLLEIALVNWSIIKVAIPVGSTSRDLIFMLYSSHIVYASGVSLWSMHVLRAQTLNSQYLKSQTGHTHILPLFESTIDPLLHIELSFLSLFL